MDCQNEMNDSKASPETQTSISHLFSSQLGVSLVSKTLKQQAQARLNMSINLLALQNMMVHNGHGDWKKLESIRSVCIPETVVLVQSYYVLNWFCNLPALSVLPM